MLHAWTDVFGTSDLAVRSLSGVVSVVTLVPSGSPAAASPVGAAPGSPC
jgi:hypothetical protein